MIDPRTGQPMQPGQGGQPMPPQGGAPQPQPQPPAQGQPPQGGAPQQGGPNQVPPEFARHIDPSNAIQMLLLQRVDKLNDADGAALQSGISPQAAQVLKKIIPEVGFLLDMIHAGQAPGQGAPMPQPGGVPQPQPGGAPMQPQAMQQRPNVLSRF